MLKTEEVTTQPVLAMHRSALLETNWNSVCGPGTYAERGTGDLNRFSKESLVGHPCLLS
jgi:hypothetical protein